jgi:hypothetical protein
MSWHIPHCTVWGREVYCVTCTGPVVIRTLQHQPLSKCALWHLLNLLLPPPLSSILPTPVACNLEQLLFVISTEEHLNCLVHGSKISFSLCFLCLLCACAHVCVLYCPYESSCFSPAAVDATPVTLVFLEGLVIFIHGIFSLLYFISFSISIPYLLFNEFPHHSEKTKFGKHLLPCSSEPVFLLSIQKHTDKIYKKCSFTCHFIWL